MAFKLLLKGSNEGVKNLVESARNTFAQEVDESYLDSLVGKRIEIGEKEFNEDGSKNMGRYFSPFSAVGVMIGWSKATIYGDDEKTELAYKYSIILSDGTDNAIGKNCEIKEQP